MVSQAAEKHTFEPWPTKALSGCLEKVRTPRKIPRKRFLENGPIPIVSQEAGFINGYWNNQDDAVEVDGPVVVFGDHTQVLKLVDFPFVVGADGVKILKPKQFLDASFLKYFLEANPVPSKGYARHFRHVKDLAVPLPPLEEQNRIVAVLDQAFAALDRAKALSEGSHSDASEIFSAYLEEVFSHAKQDWVSEKLGDICSKIGSGATPKGGANSYKSEGVSLIRSLNVYDREFREEKLALIDDEQARSLSNVSVQTQDVLFNITGASIARCCLAPERWLPARVNQHVAIIRPDPAILLPEFLCMLLTSQGQKKTLLTAGKEGGSTRQAITKSQLREFPAYFPRSTSLQAKIVKDLNRIESASLNARALYAQKLSDIEQMRQSLLQRAFTGQLN